MKKYTEKELSSKNRAQLVELLAIEGLEIEGEKPTNDSLRKQLLEVEVEETKEEPKEEPKEDSAEKEQVKSEGEKPTNDIVRQVIANRRMTAQRGIKSESSVSKLIAQRRAKAGNGVAGSVAEVIAERKRKNYK